MTVEVGAKARPDSASQERYLPRGYRQKPTRRLLVEHPLYQLELFISVPVLNSARCDTNREAIETDEADLGCATHESIIGIMPI